MPWRLIQSRARSNKESLHRTYQRQDAKYKGREEDTEGGEGVGLCLGCAFTAGKIHQRGPARHLPSRPDIGGGEVSVLNPCLPSGEVSVGAGSDALASRTCPAPAPARYS